MADEPTTTPPGSPPRPPSPQSPQSPPFRPVRPLDKGPLEDGSLDIDFDIPDEDRTCLLPIQGIVALALNEAGRQLGYGMSYYCPSNYPDSPNVPELFYNACDWSDGDRYSWDRAPHYLRLQMVTQVRAEDMVLPMRAIVQDEPQDTIEYSPEDCRLTSVVIVYDRRPFMDWYRHYAQRRDGNGQAITVDLTLTKNQEWFNSIRFTDNVEIMKRLFEWWSNPVLHGVKNYGETMDKLMESEDRRRRASLTVINRKRRDTEISSSSSSSSGSEEVTMAPPPLRSKQQGGNTSHRLPQQIRPPPLLQPAHGPQAQR